MLVPPESSSAVLVMIRSKSVSIWNHSRARLVDSSKNRTLLKGYPNFMRLYGGLLEPRRSKLALLKKRLILKISFAGCLGLYLQCFLRSSLLKCVWQPQIAKKINENPYFGVQDRSRSSMLVPPESSSAVLVMMRSRSVSIYNRSLARLDDISRNRAFWRWYPNLMHLYGELLEPRGQTLHRWYLRLMANISYAGCSVYLGWSRRNSLLNVHCSLKSLKIH